MFETCLKVSTQLSHRTFHVYNNNELLYESSQRLPGWRFTAGHKLRTYHRVNVTVLQQIRFRSTKIRELLEMLTLGLQTGSVTHQKRI